MRTDWICKDDCKVLLRLLTPANALVMEVAFDTGLRVGDVLTLRPDQIARQRFTVREHKTGKSRRVYLPKDLTERLKAQSGAVWVFAGAYDPQKHRSRQAVWKDIKRAGKAMRVHQTWGCHSARKVYAVDIYRQKGLEACRRALGHDNVAVTLIYLASELCSS